MREWDYYNNGLLGRQYQRRKNRIRLAILGLVSIISLYSISFWAKAPKLSRILANTLTKTDLTKFLGRRPVSATAPVQANGLTVHYWIDPRLQETMDQLFKRSKVLYGAFVAIDAKTGQVLAMTSYGMPGQNLNLRATFPAASVFKIVTAAAAIESGRFAHNSLIPVKGSFHTLYRQNVLQAGGLDPMHSPRYARLISFEDALAKSVNSVFGKIGLFGVGANGLRNVAERFFFGKSLPFDMPVDASRVTIPDDGFGVAESASGFTRQNTLSPLHGALIAATVANEGVMMEPGIVSQVVDAKGNSVYQFEPKSLGSVIDKSTASQLSMMMHRTITNGTSRRAFRNLHRSLALSDVFLGGKTGSLNGSDPAGRYDWFVGFGERGKSRIALAALCIHGKYYGIKASQIAREAFQTYFGPTVAEHHKNGKSRI